MTRIKVGVWGIILLAVFAAKEAVDVINLPGDISDAWQKSMGIVGYMPWLFGLVGLVLLVGSLLWPRNRKAKHTESLVPELAVTGDPAGPFAEPSPDIEIQERLATLDALTSRLQAQEQAEADRVKARDRKAAAIYALEQSERMIIQPRLSRHGMSKYAMNMDTLRFLQFNLIHIGFHLEDIEKLKADVEAEYKADAQYLAMNEKDHDIWPAATDKRQYLIFCEQRRRMIELIKGVAEQG